MEAYSLSTRVDVNLGLPWLKVCPPSTHSSSLEQSFVIKNKDSRKTDYKEKSCDVSDDNDQDVYPSHLRPHEPLAFSKSSILRTILDKFTFQSKQIFHRPPIHYSIQELTHFIKQGLAVGQDEAAVDDVELFIDLLDFKLDR